MVQENKSVKVPTERWYKEYLDNSLQVKGNKMNLTNELFETLFEDWLKGDREWWTPCEIIKKKKKARNPKQYTDWTFPCGTIVTMNVSKCNKLKVEQQVQAGADFWYDLDNLKKSEITRKYGIHFRVIETLLEKYNELENNEKYIIIE